MSWLSSTRWSLVHAAQVGDVEALDALAHKYRPPVLAYYRRRGLGAEADDLAQEVFLQLAKGALSRADQERGRFRGLLFGIARNLLRKHLAGRARDEAVPLGEAPVPAEADDEALFDREWLNNLLRQALARLSQEHPPYYQALSQFLLEGRPQREIAAELGVSANVVAQRVRRGRRKAIAYLQEEVKATSRSSQEYDAELRFLARLLPQAA